METKIKVSSVKQYTTTDRKTFSGQGAQQKALDHQGKLDRKARAEAIHDALVDHLHDILGLDLPPEKPLESCRSYEDNCGRWLELYDAYCDNRYDILQDIDASLEDMDELADRVSSFFFLTGRKKWNSIANLLDKGVNYG